MKHKVQCPCCKGDGQLTVCEEGTIAGLEDIQTFFIDARPCTHCEGTGKVEAEVEDNNNL